MQKTKDNVSFQRGMINNRLSLAVKGTFQRLKIYNETKFVEKNGGQYPLAYFYLKDCKQIR